MSSYVAIFIFVYMYVYGYVLKYNCCYLPLLIFSTRETEKGSFPSNGLMWPVEASCNRPHVACGEAGIYNSAC